MSCDTLNYEMHTCDIDGQDALSELFFETFLRSEGKQEAKLIGRLVSDLLADASAGDLYVFVAKSADELAGGILFSRLSFDVGIEAFIMAPVAVHPDFQRRGIGQRLINYALAELRKLRVELVVTYGDPDFYTKVGFLHVEEARIPAPLNLQYPAGWLAQSLCGGEIPYLAGCSRCVPALNRPEYW